MRNKRNIHPQIMVVFVCSVPRPRDQRFCFFPGIIYHGTASSPTSGCLNFLYFCYQSVEVQLSVKVRLKMASTNSHTQKCELDMPKMDGEKKRKYKIPYITAPKVESGREFYNSEEVRQHILEAV